MANTDSFYKCLNERSEVIAKKQKVLIEAWSHLNGIENKSEDEKKLYASLIEAINVDHTPISKEEFEKLINQ